MTSPPKSVDVLVIGGGPAGAATALRAAQLGHTVCLVERGANFWHRGFAQSLAPSILPLLDTLGVREEVEAAFPRSPGVMLLWGEEQPKYREFDGVGGFQVERTAFDRILRGAAGRAGATVLCPANVIDVQRTSRPNWTVRLAMDNARFHIGARIIVDAAGKRPKIPAARRRNSPPLIGILGLWRAYELREQSIVEASANCWYWAGALDADSTTAAVFFDPRSRLPANSESLPERYRRLIESSRLLAGTRGATLTRVAAYDATSRHVDDPIEVNLIRVGESAVSLDPLSSQGIQAALTGGLQAAIVVNTWLRQPRRAPAANAFYRNRHAEMIRRNQDNSRRLYAEAADRYRTAFWRQRSALQGEPPMPTSRGQPVPHPLARLRLATGVCVRPTAVVRHDLAEFAPAIVRSSPERAVAFLGDVPVGKLAEELVADTPVAQVVQTWSERVGEISALKALTWMWQTGVLVDGATQAHSLRNSISK
jgi:flavin-dependent dehydrogenase